VRSIAVTSVRTFTASIRRKIKRCGWEDSFLLSMLAQMR